MEWISVKERLPEPREFVMVWLEGAQARGGGYIDHRGLWHIYTQPDITDGAGEVTYWILPAPPEDE